MATVSRAPSSTACTHLSCQDVLEKATTVLAHKSAEYLAGRKEAKFSSKGDPGKDPKVSQVFSSLYHLKSLFQSSIFSANPEMRSGVRGGAADRRHLCQPMAPK